MATPEELVALHSPIDILSKFASLFQSRFSTGNMPWQWSAVESESTLFVGSEFSVPKDWEDASPAVIVTRGSVSHTRGVIGDTDQNNMQFLTKRGKNYWGMGDADLRIQCIGQTKGEASTIADIVATTIHMTRDPICEAFTLRDISPVVQGPTVEYERDQRKWICSVDFRIYFEERWFVVPGAPSLRKISFNVDGTTMELTAAIETPAEAEPEVVTLTGSPTQLTINPDTVLSTDSLVFLHSPINLLGQFVGLMRHRFSLGALPWQYSEVESASEIYVESEFSISSEIEDASPAIIVTRGSIVHKRDVIGDTDQNNLQFLTKRGKNYWSTGECEVRIQCIGQTKAEAATIGDIVQTTIHMTRDPICEAFTLRDISEVVLSKVVEYERDQRKWVCNVDFMVHFEHRWFTIPAAPALRQIILRGVPTLADIAPGTSLPDDGDPGGNGGGGGGVLTDELAKVTRNDALAGYLADKLIAGTNITIDLVTSGTGAQTLVINSTGGGGGGPAIEYADVSARDSVNSAIIYVGFSNAVDGSENTAALEWKILRYDSSAPVYTETYAGGTTAYDKRWTDRELYVYS